jgi:hypothetical protein
MLTLIMFGMILWSGVGIITISKRVIQTKIMVDYGQWEIGEFLNQDRDYFYEVLPFAVVS